MVIFCLLRKFVLPESGYAAEVLTQKFSIYKYLFSINFNVLFLDLFYLPYISYRPILDLLMHPVVGTLQES